MAFHGYQACFACLGSPRPGTLYVMQGLIIKYPYINSMGIYSCRNVAGTRTRSIHSCGRAGDPGIPTLSGGAANTTLGHPPLIDLIENAGALGIMGLIYNRVRYSARAPRGSYYGGVHPHRDHIHYEQTDEYALTLTRERVFNILEISTRGDTLLPINQHSSSENVRLLQDHLNFQVSSGETSLLVDGVYGPNTIARVKKKVGSLGQNAGQQAGTEVGYRQWNFIEHRVIKDWVSRMIPGSTGLTKAQADDLYSGLGHDHEATIRLK